MSNITPHERAELAQRMGFNEQYLYQCLTGRKQMAASDAVLAEQMSDGLVMRWHLRMHDWHLIWPELVSAPGAPKVSDTVAQ